MQTDTRVFDFKNFEHKKRRSIAGMLERWMSSGGPDILASVESMH